MADKNLRFVLSRHLAQIDSCWLLFYFRNSDFIKDKWHCQLIRIINRRRYRFFPIPVVVAAPIPFNPCCAGRVIVFIVLPFFGELFIIYAISERTHEYIALLWVIRIGMLVNAVVAEFASKPYALTSARWAIFFHWAIILTVIELSPKFYNLCVDIFYVVFNFVVCFNEFF